MKKVVIALCALISCALIKAQNMSQYKTLSDSAFQTNETYQKGNRYQRDAMLFVDMLTDTHPYYHKPERRDSLMQTQEALLKACAECTSDTAFTSLLYGVLGKLHDKHTDLIDTTTYALMKSGKIKKENANQITLGEKGQVMAYGGDLFHYQIFPQHSICYLQFNQCADARTQKNESLPRWDTMIDEMFQKMRTEQIQTLVVDAQYNNGGSSMLCDELLIRLCPLSEMKTFESYMRFSNLMGLYNPRTAVAKQAWDADGHHDELYPIPSNRGISKDFVQPDIFHGNVLFIQSPKTYSSAGMLMTLARDNRLGTILGETSSFSPSHYGEIIPYILPNTGVFGSISTKFFARPDSVHVDDDCLEPDVRLDLRDKDAAWQYIVDTYGIQPNVTHPTVCTEEYVELVEIIARFAKNSIFADDYAPRYQKDIEEYFSAFKNHPAVKWLSAHEKHEPWISFDAVPWFGAHIKNENEMASPSKLSSNHENGKQMSGVPSSAISSPAHFTLIPNCNKSYNRWPKKYAKEFLPLVEDFYNNSNFHQFYLDHQPMYQAAIESFRATTGDYIDTDWFASFFAPQKSRKEVTYSDNIGFTIIIALNNGAGSFGILRQKPGQNKEIGSAMLYAEHRNGLPYYETKSEEILLQVHEFCHSFLTSPKQYKKIGTRLLEEHRKKLQSVGYGIWENVIEETLVRISVIRYMLDHNYSEEAIREEIRSQHEFYGFVWIPEDINWYRGDVLGIFDEMK